ncbi:uncharacterized protein si:ch211-183d21.1 [Nerophis ophidion]|uniref:uncharacterized protein si:ch211-183d21.1 n=1 Tax=Nerophis ophidion TaxID=159077 RepID=UPI002AE041ED|nr:uncharacterized protein si:ch211-183d21.1 [Nerophis ophidion]
MKGAAEKGPESKLLFKNNNNNNNNTSFSHVRRGRREKLPRRTGRHVTRMNPRSSCDPMMLVLLCLLLVVAVQGEPCLIISEINADNPGLDTTEFVELYHTSGERSSLDGYTLVFYNGKGNVAYKVLDLKDQSTDDRGFFLVGSVDMLPKPAILLPPNTVQNGPDAIVLYHTAAARYSEKMTVTSIGLVDAVVYMTNKIRGAEVLAEILTPGESAFVEDESVLEGDESIERCLMSEDRWGFGVSSPSPGQRNNCTPPAASPSMPIITELKLGGGQVDGFVELTEASGVGPVVLVVLDGRTDKVSVSLNVDLARNGLFSMTVDKKYMKGDESGAVAIYSGSSTDFPVGSPLSQIQPLDSFVFVGPRNKPSANLTETLIPGREPYQLSSSLKEGGFYLSRCGLATWTRDPGVFWEAPQTPGQPNQCPWPKICPHSMVPGGGADASPHLPPWGNSDFLINELNSDLPGIAEDGEYIELWHPSGRRVSLQGIWILLFSAHNNKPYREISLSGHFTTAKGYFLLGSDGLVPAPSLRLPSNTIQNGPDAVALYRSPYGAPSAQRGIPTKGLLDAVVYRQSRLDKDAPELSKALTPGQLPLLEDPQVLPGDESLSRCRGLYPYDLSAFSVTPPTPLRENSCPRPPLPPEGVVISEVASGLWTNHSQQRSFVELQGPPMTDLLGLVLVVFDQVHSVIALPLKGSVDQDGFYVLGNVTGADQTFPEGSVVPARGAVVLCYDLFSVCRAGTALTNSSLRDELVFSENQLMLPLSTRRGSHVIPALRSVEDGLVSLSRCVCCEARSPSSWTTSSPTPRHSNICPSSAFSSQIDICLGPLFSDWLTAESGDCSGLIQGSRVSQVADYLEQKCLCGISALSLQGANFSCVSGWLRVWGKIRALSDHQRTLILQMAPINVSHVQADVCTTPTTDRRTSTGSTLGLQIGLIVAILLLLALGAALFTYFYRRRRPLDYSTMELSENAEGLSDL